MQIRGADNGVATLTGRWPTCAIAWAPGDMSLSSNGTWSLSVFATVGSVRAYLGELPIFPTGNSRPGARVVGTAHCPGATAWEVSASVAPTPQSVGNIILAGSKDDTRPGLTALCGGSPGTAVDGHAGRESNFTSPMTDAVAVMADTPLPFVSRQIYVGGAGNVQVEMQSGARPVFVGVAAGSIFNWRASLIIAALTTATNLVALR
jgi:hypothetical protein